MNAVTAMPATALDPRLDHARRLLDEGDHSLEVLAAATGLGPTALQKRFRAAFGLSPAEYRAQRKLASLKRELRTQGDVTRALYEAGYGSSSRVYEDGAAKLGMLPGDYKRGGAGLEIRWTIFDTELGQALLVVVERLAVDAVHQVFQTVVADDTPPFTLARPHVDVMTVVAQFREDLVRARPQRGVAAQDRVVDVEEDVHGEL